MVPIQLRERARLGNVLPDNFHIQLGHKYAPLFGVVVQMHKELALLIGGVKETP